MWGGGFHAWLLDTQLYPNAVYVSTLTGQELAGFMTDASRERPAKESSDFLRVAAWQRKDLSSWVEGGEEEEESSDEVGDISDREGVRVLGRATKGGVGVARWVQKKK